MPIVNLTRGILLAGKAATADTFLGRMTGLLGTDQPDPLRALVFYTCRCVHTFGMQYPIDTVFFDREGTVVHLTPVLPPNRISPTVSSAHGVAEFAPGVLNGSNIRLGDRLRVSSDESFRGDLAGLRRVLRWPMNLALGVLWVILAESVYQRWAESGALISPGLALVNILLLLLFILRSESRETSRRIRDWVIPAVTIAFSLMLRPNPVDDDPLGGISTTLQMAGIIGMLGSLASLGRSFGIVPARRSIRRAGAYRIIRHPLYASELLFFFGFLLGNLTLFNVLALLVVLFGLVWRAGAEEKLLRENGEYARYMSEVKYRLIPGAY